MDIWLATYNISFIGDASTKHMIAVWCSCNIFYNQLMLITFYWENVKSTEVIKNEGFNKFA